MFRIEYIEHGVKRQPIFSNDIKNIGQILINIANDEEAENEAMDWCSKASFGQKFTNQKYKFSIYCVRDTGIINNDINVSNTEIAKVLRTAIEQHKEFHGTIYANGCWKLDIERHPYGTIRLWVSREDKSGNYQCSLCTPYYYNGEIVYSAEFKVAKHVENKIKSVGKYLSKLGIL